MISLINAVIFQDIIRYSIVVIGLSLGVAGYADGVTSGRELANRYDREAEAIGKVDTASEELRDFAIQYAVSAVSIEALV